VVAAGVALVSVREERELREIERQKRREEEERVLDI
jgi:heme exporter protein D